MFIYRIKLPLYFSLIFLKLLSFIIATSAIPSLPNKDTSLVYVKKAISGQFIKDNSDLFLISTKDGYLHSIDKNNKEIWKTYLEQELMSSTTFSKIEFGKDFILYPKNDQIYIYKDNNLISFNIFVKNLVESNFITLGKYILIGKTKTTFFIIDVDTGEIIQKIVDEINFTFKKRYILTKNKNIITVARVDYILSCLEVGKQQQNWNICYSDIRIQKGNEYFFDNFKFIPPNLKSIINEYNINNDNEKNDINIDNVITAYSYFNKNLPTIKIYDRNNSESLGEIRHLINNSSEENILEYKDNNNKSNIDKNNHFNINQNKKYNLFQKLKNNWYLYIIIIILFVQLIYYKGFYITTKEKEKEEKEESNLKKDDEKNIKKEKINNRERLYEINNIKEYNANFEDSSIDNNKTISFKNGNILEKIPIKKYSFDNRIKSK